MQQRGARTHCTHCNETYSTVGFSTDITAAAVHRRMCTGMGPGAAGRAGSAKAASDRRERAFAQEGAPVRGGSGHGQLIRPGASGGAAASSPAAAVGAGNKNYEGEYSCETCSETFSSVQSLGGHRRHCRGASEAGANTLVPPPASSATSAPAAPPDPNAIRYAERLARGDQGLGTRENTVENTGFSPPSTAAAAAANHGARSSLPNVVPAQQAAQPGTPPGFVASDTGTLGFRRDPAVGQPPREQNTIEQLHDMKDFEVSLKV